MMVQLLVHFRDCTRDDERKGRLLSAAAAAAAAFVEDADNEEGEGVGNPKGSRIQRHRKTAVLQSLPSLLLLLLLPLMMMLMMMMLVMMMLVMRRRSWLW